VRPLFLLRWAARDLRRRWLQVAAIALVIAIGTGVYSALGSTSAWRRESNDASFAALGMYDLRVRAADGADAPAGAMRSVLDALPDPSIVSAAEERLIERTQVDASHGGATILVPGRLIGVDVARGGPHVNGLYVASGHGRSLTAADAAADDVVVLERNFADFHDLASQGRIRVAGGRTLRYVGTAMTPEYFFVMTEEGGFFAQANFAAVIAPLHTVQALTGKTDRVNDLVLKLRPGTDVARARSEVDAAFASSDLGLGATVMRAEDEDAYRVLYDDIEGDAKFWNVFAALILAGAAFGAFNLVNRMVEAQRREIGIGMALGQSPAELALRPLLVGVQIALLGAVLGVGVGLLVNALLRPLYTSMLPMPVWRTAFQPGRFARGAILGFVVPVVATAWPVWRAVRVTPVEAITTTHRSARSGLASLLRRLRWPSSAFRRMPIGNVLRTPRRTLLTGLGIGAAIATLVVVLCLLDSFFATMDRNERELLRNHSDRVAVAVDGFVPVDGGVVDAIARDPTVGAVEPVLRVAGTLQRAGRAPLDVLLEAIDMGSDVWSPSVVDGALGAGGNGIVVAEKAASDLGVRPGDTVTLEHPARRGAAFAMVRTPVRVAGIHPGPFRFNAYLDRSQLSLFGADGFANELYVVPAPGRTVAEVERALFDVDGVTSVQPVAAGTQVARDSIDEFVSVFRVLQAFTLLLALLIAYNATSINADERARERATLFAFGLPLRRVLGLETAEGLLIGLLGTAFGVAGGLLTATWLTRTTIETTMPDMGLDVVMTSSTLTTAVVLGVLAVALAPLLTVRRLRRMDIPGTLRVVE
jgi:putative ABC transport system permease protein